MALFLKMPMEIKIQDVEDDTNHAVSTEDEGYHGFTPNSNASNESKHLPSDNILNNENDQMKLKDADDNLIGSASSIIDHLTRPGSTLSSSNRRRNNHTSSTSAGSSSTSTLISPGRSSSSSASSSPSSGDRRAAASSPTPLLLHQHHRGPTAVSSSAFCGTKLTSKTSAAGSGRQGKLVNGPACSPGGGTGTGAGPNQHVVHVHVNPGEVFSVRLDDQIQHIEGPATVRMISNSGPPLPMPMQVPPGHMVQQIVDENGILTHVILSPQHPVPPLTSAGHPPPPQAPPTATPISPQGPPSLSCHTLSASSSPLSSGPPSSSQHYFTGQANGDSSTYSPFSSPNNSNNSNNSNTSGNNFLHHHNDLSSKSRFNCHGGGGDRQNGPMNEHEDRATRQKHRLQEKHARQYVNNNGGGGGGHNNGGGGSDTRKDSNCSYNHSRGGGHRHSGNSHASNGHSPRHHHTIEKQINKPDDENQIISNFLSRISTPQVSGVDSRSVLICIAVPDLDAVVEALLACKASTTTTTVGDGDGDVAPFNSAHLNYKLRLSEKGRCGKYKSVYSGDATEITLKDLKPATEYHLKIESGYKDLVTQSTDAVCFKTLPCSPDQPTPPKVSIRSRTSIVLKWNATSDNGSKILNYILQCDSETIYTGLPRQFKVAKLMPSTGYNFRLCAVNSFGSSEFTDNITYHTSGSVPTPPDMPRLVDSFVRTLVVDWPKRPNDDAFTLQMEDYTSGHGFLPVFNGPDTSHSIRNLKRNTEYKFRLNASNEEGCSKWSDIATYRTLPDRPCPPSRPQSKGKISSRSLRIQWDPPKDTGGCGIDNYRVQIETDGKENSGLLCYDGCETECFIENLLPGQTYLIKANCLSDGGRSDWSPCLSICTQPIKPGCCENVCLQQKAKSHYVNLKWDPPSDTGGSIVCQYDVQMLSADCAEGVTEPNTVYTGRAPQCVVAGLSPGQKYTFEVRASNSAGTGPWSNSFLVHTCSAAPDAPTVFDAVLPITPHSLSLAWQPPTNDNGAAVTDYRLEWMSGSDFTLLYNGQSLNHEVKSLQPFTIYKFRLQAINSSGTSHHGNVLTLRTAVSSPAAVASVKARPLTSNSLRLTLKPPCDNGAPITSYVCELSASCSSDGLATRRVSVIPDAPPPSTTPTSTTPTTSSNSDNQMESHNQQLQPQDLQQALVAASPAIPSSSSHVSLTLDDLLSETVYKIRVQAVNSVGVGPLCNPIKSQTLSRPPLPPLLEAVHIASNSMKLRWTDQKSADLLTYRLEMAKDENSPFSVVYNGASNTHKVNKLVELTSYLFRICSINNAGEGPFCEPALFTTTKTVPPAVKAARVSNLTTNSCLIEWPVITALPKDSIAYSLQIQRRNCEFQKVFHGSQNSYELTLLASNTDYSARVCAVRQTLDSPDLIGAFSPCLQFRTLPSSSSSSSSATGSSSSSSSGPSSSYNSSSSTSNSCYSQPPNHSGDHSKRSQPLSDQQWAVIILIGFAALAVLVAFLAQQFIA